MEEVLAEAREQVRRLQEQARVLSVRVEELERENRQLREQLAEAQQAAARQAGPFRREPRRKVPESQKKRPGRGQGHAGANRMVPEQVDEQVDVPLAGCPKCGGPLTDVVPLEQYIEEIPAVRPHVTRLVTDSGECACGGEVHSTHPLPPCVRLQSNRGHPAIGKTLARCQWHPPGAMPTLVVGMFVSRGHDMPRHSSFDTSMPPPNSWIEMDAGENSKTSANVHAPPHETAHIACDAAGSPLPFPVNVIRPSACPRNIGMPTQAWAWHPTSSLNSTRACHLAACWETLTSLAQTCHQRGLNFIGRTNHPPPSRRQNGLNAYRFSNLGPRSGQEAAHAARNNQSGGCLPAAVVVILHASVRAIRPGVAAGRSTGGQAASGTRRCPVQR